MGRRLPSGQVVSGQSTVAHGEQSRWQPFLFKFCVTDTVSMGVCPQRQVSNVPLPAKPSSTGKAYYVMEARHCSCAVVACGAKRALALLNGVWGSQGRAPKGYSDLVEAVNACAELWHTDIVHLHLPLEMPALPLKKPSSTPQRCRRKTKDASESL